MNLTTSSASDKRYTASTADIPGPSEPGSNSGSTEQKEDVNLVQTSLGHQIGIKRKAVSLDRPVTSILFSNDEVNYLIYRYLEENGFSHTAYLFGNESNVYTAQFDPTRVPKGALVKILQKGVFFAEAERFALLGGDAVDKYEKTAGTVSLLESANPPAPKKVCGVVDQKLISHEVSKLRKERRKDQISLIKQRAEAAALLATSPRPTQAEVEAHQAATKAALKSFRDKEHEREKETKEFEKKDKLVACLPNGVQTPGHIRAKISDNKKTHVSTSTSQHLPQPPIVQLSQPTTSHQLQQNQSQQHLQQSQSQLQIQPSSSRQQPQHDVSNQQKDSNQSIPKIPTTNHTNNIRPHSSSIGIAQPSQQQQTSQQPTVPNILNTPQNVAIQDIHRFATLMALSGGNSQKELENFILKQFIPPAATGPNNAGNQQQSGGAIAQKLQLLQLHQQPLSIQSYSFGLEPGLTENFGFSWNPKNSRLCAIGFAYGNPKIFQLPLEKPITQWTQNELKAKCINLIIDAKIDNEEHPKCRDMEFPSCDWNSQGTMLVTTNFSGKVSVWTSKGKLVSTVNGHNAAIMGVSFSPNGERFFTIGMDRKVILWEANTGRVLQTYNLRGITDYHWLNDDIFACCSVENEIVILRVGNELPVRTLCRKSGEVNSIRFDRAETKYLAAGGDDALLVIWDISRDEPLAKFSGHTKGIHMLRWSPKGIVIATSGLDNQIIVWHLFSGRPFLNFHHTESTYSLNFSPNGKLLACATFDHKMFVYSLDSGNIIASLTYKSSMFDLSFDSTGEYIASLSQNCLVISDLRQFIKANELQEESKKKSENVPIGIKT